MNKAQMQILLPIIGVVIVIIIIFAVVVGTVGAGGTITNPNPIVPGCTPGDLPVTIRGSVFTTDKAFWGVIAEPESITVDEVRSGTTLLRAFTEQQFTWKIQLIDDFTGNVRATDGGTNRHPGGNTLVEDKYNLNFFIPDNDCDGSIRGESFEGKLVFTVTTDDGEKSSIQRHISLVNGRFIR